jgi:anti-anti-sigma factor
VSTTLAKYGDVVVLTPKVDLIGDQVEQFVAKAAEIASERTHSVVVDCSAVEGLDSLGLESLIDLQTRCEDELGSVKLCAVDETCRKILEITRLSRRFEIFDDLESAVKSFA